MPPQRTSARTRIGTTGRGIGPAYVDRVARTGIRFARPRATRPRSSEPAVGDAEVVVKSTIAAARRLRPHIVDGVAYIHDVLARDKRVLLEGAQGTLLDVGYGTYPYVTSSQHDRRRRVYGPWHRSEARSAA